MMKRKKRKRKMIKTTEFIDTAKETIEFTLSEIAALKAAAKTVSENMNLSYDPFYSIILKLSEAEIRVYKKKLAQANDRAVPKD